MGLYGYYVFPRLMDAVMSKEPFQRQRQEALKEARGTVLEIGFGTGLNVSHYPATVTWLTGIDLQNALPRRVEERSIRASFPIEVLRQSADRLPFDDERFDCVVSTWTLCTIRDVRAALREIRRVLKPAGALLFLEHGLSEDPKIVRWQKILNPFQRLFACGCHLNRPIDRLIREAGFTLERLDRFQMDEVPKPGGAMYRGVARPPA